MDSPKEENSVVRYDALAFALIVPLVLHYGQVRTSLGVSMPSYARYCQIGLYRWLTYIPTNAPKTEPTTKAYKLQKQLCRETMGELCDAYLIMLPKLMGCLVCQYAHTITNSERYGHMVERKIQLEKLKLMLENNEFDPHDVLTYIETSMCPFKGEFGKAFQRQCNSLLTNLTKQWQ